MDTSTKVTSGICSNVTKCDKVISLTTHFMDEYNYLGGKIGIMSDG